MLFLRCLLISIKNVFISINVYKKLSLSFFELLFSFVLIHIRSYFNVKRDFYLDILLSCKCENFPFTYSPQGNSTGGTIGWGCFMSWEGWNWEKYKIEVLSMELNAIRLLESNVQK